MQLMRVYGALLWSLGKVLNTPEVMRVYIGYNYLTPFLKQIFKWSESTNIDLKFVMYN